VRISPGHTRLIEIAEDHTVLSLVADLVISSRLINLEIGKKSKYSTFG